METGRRTKSAPFLERITGWASRAWRDICALSSQIRRDTRAGALQLTAFSLVPIVGATGMAVDGARLYLVKDNLQRAVDSAGLAAGHALELADMSVDATEFFNANFEQIASVATLSSFDVVISPDNNVITVSARAEIDTTFMRIFGTQTVEIAAQSEVTRETRGMELMMVLDVTGSMAGSKIAAMRDAATDLTNIVYGDDDINPNLWVGVVPYSIGVNVGSNHSNWLTLASQNYITSGAFHPTSWKGCVMARTGGLDETDDTPDIQAFTAFEYPYDVDNQWKLFDDDGQLTGYDIRDTYNHGNNGRGPNLTCPHPILPLTSSKTAVLSHISSLTYWGRGGTSSNIGLAWGWRAISPKWRGLWQGASSADLPLDYSDPYMDKVVVMMTDGQNQFYDWRGHSPNNGSGPLGSDFTPFGRKDTFGFGGNTTSEINARFARTCEAMKAEGIILYTITFGSGASNTTIRNLYTNCASKQSFYFHAPSDADLQDVFATIGRQLSNLRLSK